MGRQQNNNLDNRGKPAQELLGFHFSTPAPAQQMERNRNRNFQNNNNNRRKKNNNAYKPSAQDRTAVRRKANSAMFNLHSSSEHQFFLTRQAHSKFSKGKYSFEGSDSPVSWESVRIVKQLLVLSPNKVEEEPSCPVCLSDFVSARITKCGHVFCLSCLLHHVHAQAHSSHHVKCPCCGVPIHLEDLRSVLLETVVAPETQQSITLVKLHREKTCSAPYIPIPGNFKHSHPSCVPCMGENDEKFSRFNYVDLSVYLSLLYQNRTDLEEEAKSLPQNCMDLVFVQMALEMVVKDIQTAEIEASTEATFQQDIVKPTSGFYQQLLPDPLLASLQRGCSVGSEKEVSESDEAATEKPKSNKWERFAGSLYMDEASTVEYYQSEDGQLVFLSGFNMNCLLADFRRGRPAEDSEEELRYPLPDKIKGRILELDRKNMTPELQKRLPFLSHLPLYVDFIFVELDLNHILSEQAKEKFKSEFAKRRKRRQSKIKAEKMADKAKERQEMELINERRSRLQLIDPEDDFFRPYVPPEETNLSPENFEATLGGDPSSDVLGTSPPLSSSPRIRAPPQNQGLNFRAAARDNGLVVSSTEAFPKLGSTVSNPSSSNPTAPSPWGGTRPIQQENFPALSSPVKKAPVVGGKKKGKGGGKGQLLFSTGGQRGAGYR